MFVGDLAEAVLTLQPLLSLKNMIKKEKNVINMKSDFENIK